MLSAVALLSAGCGAQPQSDGTQPLVLPTPATARSTISTSQALATTTAPQTTTPPTTTTVAARTTVPTDPDTSAVSPTTLPGTHNAVLTPVEAPAWPTGPTAVVDPAWVTIRTGAPYLPTALPDGVYWAMVQTPAIFHGWLDTEYEESRHGVMFDVAQDILRRLVPSAIRCRRNRVRRRRRGAAGAPRFAAELHRHDRASNRRQRQRTT